MRCELRAGHGRRRARAFASRSTAARTTSCATGAPCEIRCWRTSSRSWPSAATSNDLAAADAGRDPVGRASVGDRAVDDGTRRGHRVERGRVDLDLRAAARDGEHLVEREVGAGEDDA